MRRIEEIEADATVALAMKDADALEALANELDDLDPKLHEVKILNLRATVCRYRGQYQESITLNMKVLKILESTGNIKRIAVTLGNVGNAYDDLGDLTKSLEYKERALEIMLQHGMMKDAALVYVNLGATHRKIGDNVSALEFYNRGLAIYETASDIVGINGVATVTGNMANLFRTTGDISTSLEYYFRSLELYEQIGNVAEAGRTTGNIGTVYAEIGDAETAIEKLEHALDTATKLGDGRLQVLWLDNIGATRWQQGQISEAISCFRAALSLYMQVEHMQPPHNLQINIVKAMMDDGDIDEARRLFSNIDADSIAGPDTRAFYLATKAELQMLDQDHEGAKLSLEQCHSLASQTSSRKHELRALKGLRNLALQQRDLDAYVRFNEDHQKLEQDLQAGDARRRLALHEQKRVLDVERQQRERERAILHSTLPQHIADRVVRGETVNDQHDNAAVIFLDIVGFTALSELLSSAEVVQLLETVFTALDNVCMKHDVVKIKTIGDSYMAVAFPHFVRNDTDHLSHSSEEHVIPNIVRDVSERAANAALDMLQTISHIVSPASSPIQVRIGMHCGPVTAGVIGTQRMQYDVWGDTVNVASRMEGASEPGRIHVSEAFAYALELRHQELRQGDTDVIPSESEERGNSSPFPVPCSLIERGALEIKGKGTMSTYWLERLEYEPGTGIHR